MFAFSGSTDVGSSSAPVMFVESNLTAYNAYALEIATARGMTTHFVAREPDEYVDMRPDVLTVAGSVGVVDTYDVGKLIHHAAAVRPRALIAVDDYRLIPTAIAAQALGLPHADVTGLVNCHFKDRTRGLCDGIGRPVRFAILDRADLVRSSPVGYPCVLKPLDDSGSTGVTVCQDDADFSSALQRAAEVRLNQRGYECAGSLLVEEFVGGEEFTAECAWDGLRERWQLLGYTKKLLGPPPSPVETGAMFPYWFETGLDTKIEDLVYRWLDAVNHRRGAAHVEFKVLGDDVTLIEINPRLGGDQIRDLIRLTSGVDPLELYLDLALGEPTPVQRAETNGRVAASFYKLPPRTGTVLRVSAPPEVGEGIVRHRLLSHEMTVTGVRDNDDRLGYVIAEATDPATCLSRARGFMEDVEVEFAR